MADSANEVAMRLECLQQAVRLAEITLDPEPVLNNAKDFYTFVWHGNVPKKAGLDPIPPVPDDEIPF